MTDRRTILKAGRHGMVLILLYLGLVYALGWGEEQFLADEEPSLSERHKKLIAYMKGSAQGFKGPIDVSVGMVGDTITAIKVLHHTEDMDWYVRAKAVIPAMLAAQSTEVDSISGATFSSQGIINAVRNALGLEVTIASEDSAQNLQDSGGAPAAGIDVTIVTEAVPVEDDAGEGEAVECAGADAPVRLKGWAKGFKGPIKVAVVMDGNTITRIKVLHHTEDLDWYRRARAVIPAMLAVQSTKVDIISGATYSSRGIINAVANALGKGGNNTLAGSVQGSTSTSAVSARTEGIVTVAEGEEVEINLDEMEADTPEDVAGDEEVALNLDEMEEDTPQKAAEGEEVEINLDEIEEDAAETNREAIQ